MSLTGYYDQSYPPSLWGGGGGVADPNISSIAPNTAVVGTGAKTITVTGTNFQPDSVIEFDQAPITTTYLSATSLTGSYTPTVVGAKTVTVRNGGSGGEESNSVTFTVTATELQGFTATPIDREDSPMSPEEPTPEPEPEEPTPET